ncbi:MAG: glutamine-hydrolyzing GMP synthase [Parcubacteria group bacterium]
MSPHQDEIVILDFGSQYTHLIARRIRELGVFSRILPPDTPAGKLQSAKGVILSGGPQSVYDEKIQFDKKIFDLTIPVLGLCYGHQLMAYVLGGHVEGGTVREYGTARLRITPSEIFEKVLNDQPVWMSHGDSVTELPAGFSAVGATDDCPIAAMADEHRRLYGFQFHPEVAHTAQGITMLRNFIFIACQAKPSWTEHEMLENILRGTRNHVGDRSAFLLVSGGVDSTVCFALLEKALGKERVYGLHVDSGLMRLDESRQVAETLAKAGFDNLHVVDAREKFLDALSGIIDPEEKRKVIGKTFLAVKEEAMKLLGLDDEQWVLAQGTIYPDTIETGRTKHADVIKTHHNRIPEIQKMVTEGRIVEPLKDLYKDEVRKLGEDIGLPKELVWRHPFPGPGLGIRILCENQVKTLSDIPSEHTEALQRAVRDAGETTGEAQVLPVRSVGVQGDQRSYHHPALILGMRDLQKVGILAPALANRLPFINRVITLVGGDAFQLKAAKTHRAHITPDRVKLLQVIDAEVNRIIHEEGLYDQIWQFPVVLLPFGVDEKESIVLRPIQSREAMTVDYYPLAQKVIAKIVERIQATGSISFVFYDVTNKPPGTIEWE